jgi:hypothetical protein
MARSPWFKKSVAYRRIPPDLRKDLSQPHRSTCLRIAHMPPSIGEELDRRGAPLRVYRFIGWAGLGEEAMRRRYELVLRLHEALGRWPRDEQMYAALAGETDAPCAGR